MSLMNAFNFEDFSDAREILMRAAGIKGRIGLEPQRENIDDDRASANQDAWDEDFVKWIDDEVVGTEYITVFNIFERLNIDEEPFMALEEMLPGGDSEKVVVKSDQVKEFASLLRKKPQEAIQNYVRSINSLYDDDDLKDTFSDREEYNRIGPDRYFNAPL